MANRRFIDFPIASTVGDSDIILIWQSGANKQTTKATFLSGLPENLDELNDVTISGLTNGQILRYDSVTGKWENTDQGNLDLNDLNDVSIVSPSNGQVLVYNSSTSKWENSSGGYVPYTGAVTTVNLGAQTIQAGQFVKAGGTSAQFLKADGSIDSNTYGTGTVTSVALTMPSAFNVANSPITTAGTLAVTGAGTVGQYIRGDGSLADFPQASGGGSSVSYYLNGSISQGTIGGVAYKELNKVPILGTGTDFTINANGYIASFLTDAGDPNLLEIPGGNWNFETYFSASSSGGSPSFYVELYKYNGTTFTLIASSSSSPELIAFGTNLNPYFSTLAVPTTTLALTDRLAIRYYVNHSGRTITLHTENNHLCQVVTTFTTGLTSLNGLTAQVQNLAVGTSGTDFNIASATATHTFNLPTASATNRGALSSADWSTFNNKQNALGYVPVPETRTITINGTSQDLSANRTYNVGTVTSVGLSSATSGVTIGSTPVTTSGTITLAIATASGSQNGLLSSTDWTTFNGKQNALTNPVTGTGTTNYLPKFTGASTIGNSNLINDASGNLGLGVTPSAWANGFTALQVRNASIWSTGNDASFTANAYYDGSNYRFIGNAGASRVYHNTDGSIGWSQVNSGTAGNPISFTQAMTLFPTGNLLVGSPSPISDNGARLQVSGTATVSSNIAIGGTITSLSDTDELSIFAGTTIVDNRARIELYGPSHATLANQTIVRGNQITFTSSAAATQYMTINSSGNVGINTNNPSYLLDLWSFNPILRIRNITAPATGGTSSLLFEGINNFSGVSQSFINSIQAGNSGATQLVFGTSGTVDATATERMRITSSGNVGIGTSSPATRLMVQDSGNTFVGHFSGLNQTNGVAIGTNSLNVAVIQGYTRTFSATNNIALQTDGGNVLIGTTTDVGAKLAVNGVISSLGNAILSNSGNLTMTGTYQTIFTAGTDSAYFLTVQTNAIDGTFAIFALYNENSTERATSTILGNNIQVQFSGNDVQIRSVNGASYTVTYGTIRIK